MNWLAAWASCVGKEGRAEGVPKERWVVSEGIVVINLGIKDFRSLMWSCAETQALESLSQGQTLSLSSCISLLNDAMRL